MFVKIDNTGCCERNQMLQIRFAMYLDSADYNYDKTRAEVFERVLTVEELNDETLAAKIGKVWQTNPFHNHFAYVDPSLSNEGILILGETLLKQAYAKWVNNSTIDLINVISVPVDKTALRLIACTNRLQQLQTASLKRRV